jgi:VIT1/CCC1 family predicted Fe2+/Mn2+ transporter
MTEFQMSEFGAILKFILGVFLPLLGSALVPNGWQRLGAALFALIAICVVTGMLGGSNPLRWGLSVGFVLAATKLTAGIRFL